MLRLIINADDLGMNPQRSHGIFQCHEFGVVTSASLLPNCADSDASAKHARERELPVGLHLNFTEEYSLSPSSQVSTLVDANGRFLNRERLRELLDDGEIDPAHIEREARSQIEWFFDAHGSAPTHLDGHHHIHVHLPVLHALLPLMERYGIRFMRVPIEEPLPPFGYEVSEEQLASTAKLNERAFVMRELLTAHGIGFTDHFRGATLVGNASLKNLRHTISRLLPGVTELMVHPGSQTNYGTPFDLDPQRQTELRMLLDESIPAQLTEKKVELCSFADV